MCAGNPKTRRSVLLCATALPVLVTALVGGAVAQPEFTPLVRLWKPTSLEVVDGTAYCGTNDGGLLRWQEGAPDAVDHWLAGTELTSAAVADIAWTGRHLWVATADGGMTRVADPGGDPRFDFFANSLRSAAVTAVAGGIFADTERVWYGAGGQGLGEIIGDQPGALYTAETDGLISNEIRDLAVLGEELFIGTPVGVSRFTDGVFTDALDGLTAPGIQVLMIDGNGELLSGGGGGVHRWDAGAESWVHLGNIGRPVADLADHGGTLYALGIVQDDVASLHRWNGSAFDAVAMPADLTEALGAGAELWLAGREIRPDSPREATYPLFHARRGAGDTYTKLVSGESPVPQPFGVTIGDDDRVWAGDFGGQTFAAWDDDGVWQGVFARASADPDSSGLIGYGGNMLFMTTGIDGTIWSGQLNAGVLRHDPVAWHTDPVVVSNSGLASPRLINGVTHPAGPIIFCFDNNDNSGVKMQVLVEPDAWRNPDNWATPDGTVLRGLRVTDAVVERNDVLWLAVWGTGGGVLRWDVNGLNAGPDDPLTWTDPTDDLFGPWVDFVSGAPNDLSVVDALARDASGTIWAGGNGLVGFRFDERFNETTLVADFGTRSPDEDGLISSNVTDVAVDRNGYVWVVSAGGLNRVRPVGGGHAIDAWFDVVTYSANVDYGILYSPSRVSELTGVNHDASRLVASAAGDRLVLSSTRGVTVIEAGAPQSGGQGDGSSAYLYPNPWEPDADSRLAVGGVPVASGELMEVGIYNLEGQLVYRDPEVQVDIGFWSGNNRVGEPVTSGMYLVRVTWSGNTILRTLAVVR